MCRREAQTMHAAIVLGNNIQIAPNVAVDAATEIVNKYENSSQGQRSIPDVTKIQ